MPIGATTACGRRRIFSGERGSCHPHATSLSRSVVLTWRWSLARSVAAALLGTINERGGLTH